MSAVSTTDTGLPTTYAGSVPPLAPKAKVSPAVIAAQAELSNPPKTKKAIIKSDRGTFTYTYADLAGVIDHVRQVLARHGLGFTQDVKVQDGRLMVSTKILHESGEALDFGPIAAPAPADMQKLGGAITYVRRYALVAALGIAADDDDDGSSASEPVKEEPAKVQPVKQQPKQRLQAVKQAPASDDDIARWVGEITAATHFVQLKSIADEIAAHQLEEDVREELLAMWTDRKAEVAK